MGHHIYTQWPDQNSNQVSYIGPVFKPITHFSKKLNSDYVFATVGTRLEEYPRMIRAIEELIKNGSIKEKVIVQAGYTKYNSEHLDIFDFCSEEKIDDLIKNAKYVITQESAGIGTKCLKFNTKFLVMPRDYMYGEVTAISDMREDLHVHLEKLKYTRIVNNASELENAINEIGNLKVGYSFDNKLAIDTLTRIMEE